MLQLHQRISITKDFPEYNLKKGDIAILIDTATHPERGENGYVLEVFNAIGESINIIIVPMSAVEPLKQDEIFSVRSLVEII